VVNNCFINTWLNVNIARVLGWFGEVTFFRLTYFIMVKLKWKVN
jgi:hypothetical protein